MATNAKTPAKRFNLAVTSEDEALVAMLGRTTSAPETPASPVPTAQTPVAPVTVNATETLEATSQSETASATASVADETLSENVPLASENAASETVSTPPATDTTTDNAPAALVRVPRKRAAVRRETPDEVVAESPSVENTPRIAPQSVAGASGPGVVLGATAATVSFYQTLRGKDRYIYMLLYNVTVNAGVRFWQGRLSDFCRLYQETYNETLSEETARRQFGRLEVLRLVQRHYIPGDQRGMMYECTSLTEAGHAPELQAEMEWLLTAKGLKS